MARKKKQKEGAVDDPSQMIVYIHYFVYQIRSNLKHIGLKEESGNTSA
mgnify:CR=1 FL=1